MVGVKLLSVEKNIFVCERLVIMTGEEKRNVFLQLLICPTSPNRIFPDVFDLKNSGEITRKIWIRL
jgi:hypothetical protein